MLGRSIEVHATWTSDRQQSTNNSLHHKPPSHWCGELLFLLPFEMSLGFLLKSKRMEVKLLKMLPKNATHYWQHALIERLKHGKSARLGLSCGPALMRICAQVAPSGTWHAACPA